MTTFYIGDIPSETLAVTPLRAGNLVELSPFTAATAVLRNEAGIAVTPAPSVTLDQANDDAKVTFGTASPFATAGLYSLQIIVTATGKRETLDAVQIVVQDPATGWHTLDSIRGEWTTGMPDDSIAYQLLEVAREQCATYGPRYEGLPPRRFRVAQAMQARNIFNASKTDPGQSQDGELFVIRPYPLDNFVKDILRPKRVLGVIG